MPRMGEMADSEKIRSAPEVEQVRTSNSDTDQFSTGQIRLFGCQGSNMALYLFLGKPQVAQLPLNCFDLFV